MRSTTRASRAAGAYPFGNLLAGPNFESEAILVAEIDRAQVVRGKYDLDVVGHYARPDIFQLHVDERPKRAVSSETETGKAERQKAEGQEFKAGGQTAEQQDVKGKGFLPCHDR